MKKYELAFSADDETLSPAECIELMFKHTGRFGKLYIPEWPYDGFEPDGEKCLRLDMAWNEEDKNNAVSFFESLYSALKEIASSYDKLGDTLEENKAVLSPALLEVWDTYVRGFDIGDIDFEKIYDISERKDAGERVTDDEMALLDKHRDLVHKDAESRLKNKLAAYDVIIRAKRVCKLASLKAPEEIVNFEARLLAQAIVVNFYAVSMDTVINK